MRAERCRFEDGTGTGIGVQAGGKIELVGCRLGLTIKGSACMVAEPGSCAVLRGCCIKGCATGPSHTDDTDFPLGSFLGGALALEACQVDVDGCLAAVVAMNPGDATEAVSGRT
jgi:hypothetical protein